jgi:hypothetical protein
MLPLNAARIIYSPRVFLLNTPMPVHQRYAPVIYISSILERQLKIKLFTHVYMKDDWSESSRGTSIGLCDSTPSGVQLPCLPVPPQTILQL